MACMQAADLATVTPPPITLWRLFVRFLRFGCLAFGGPIAQIGMLRTELVERERWASPQHFLRALAVYQALPGPEAHELCCWFGLLARGRRGALLAGLGFLLPGFCLMLLCASLYTRYGMRSPWVASAFVGMQPAVIALVVRAVPRIGKHALMHRIAWPAAIVGAISGLADLPFALPLVFGALWLSLAARGRLTQVLLLLTASLAAAIFWPADNGITTAASAATLVPILQPTFWSLLWLGLQAGLLTFGGAYTAIPFVRDGAVVKHQWLSDAQFLDGLAIGGVLPAPLLIFGTFTGHVAFGLPGALAMTLGIFAPAFSFTLIGHTFIERAMHAKRLQASLSGIAAVVTGLIAATAVRLCWQHVAPQLFSASVFCVALAIALRWRSAWVVPVIVALAAISGIALNS